MKNFIGKEVVEKSADVIAEEAIEAEVRAILDQSAEEIGAPENVRDDVEVGDDVEEGYGAPEPVTPIQVLSDALGQHRAIAAIMVVVIDRSGTVSVLMSDQDRPTANFLATAARLTVERSM